MLNVDLGIAAGSKQPRRIVSALASCWALLALPLSGTSSPPRPPSPPFPPSGCNPPQAMASARHTSTNLCSCVQPRLWPMSSDVKSIFHRLIVPPFRVPFSGSIAKLAVSRARETTLPDFFSLALCFSFV